MGAGLSLIVATATVLIEVASAIDPLVVPLIETGVSLWEGIQQMTVGELVTVREPAY